MHVRVYNHDDDSAVHNSRWKSFAANESVEDTETFTTPLPESELCYVEMRFDDNNVADRPSRYCYTWRFATRTDNSDAGIASWVGLEETPLELEVGETAAVTVTFKDDFFSGRERKVFIGDESVLSVRTQDSDSPTATLTLTGLKPGRTTIRVFYYENGKHYSTSTAKEIVVTGDSPSGGSSSGGGCSSAGFGALSLLALAAAALLKRKA